MNKYAPCHKQYKELLNHQMKSHDGHAEMLRKMKTNFMSLYPKNRKNCKQSIFQIKII